LSLPIQDQEGRHQALLYIFKFALERNNLQLASELLETPGWLQLSEEDLLPFVCRKPFKVVSWLLQRGPLDVRGNCIHELRNRFVKSFGEIQHGIKHHFSALHIRDLDNKDKGAYDKFLSCVKRETIRERHKQDWQKKFDAIQDFLLSSSEAIIDCGEILASFLETAHYPEIVEMLLRLPPGLISRREEALDTLWSLCEQRAEDEFSSLLANPKVESDLNEKFKWSSNSVILKAFAEQNERKETILQSLRSQTECQQRHKVRKTSEGTEGSELEEN